MRTPEIYFSIATAGFLTVVTGCLTTVAVPNSASAKVDFVKEIKPIFEQNCVACHNTEHAAKENGHFSMATKAETLKGGEDHGENDLIPGEAEKSFVYKLLVTPKEDKMMPPKGKGSPLTTNEIELVRRWITEGATWPEGLVLTNVMRIVYARDVEPILGAGGNLSEKSKETLQSWIQQGAKGATSPKQSQMVSKWIAQGGPMPAALKVALVDKELELIKKIHKKIVADTKEKTVAEMKSYTNTIPGTTVTYAMVPIPAGEFVMGSPNGEKKRKEDEGPQHKVKVEPFWMEKYEVTWNEYELFMYPEEIKARTSADATTNYVSNVADACTRPTKPYVEMSFGMGKDGFPAISMTQHAANKYCEWLSARTGHFYRLPTEAEWEYAARAGTKTAYFFGDDEKKLGEYAWDADNSDFKYQKVGKKKPNPWGLYDVHGNVAEWCLDQYDPEFYKNFVKSVSENDWNKSTKPYPHVVRGGGWDDDADRLRSAARRGSAKSWKQQDPQLPKSIWFLTDAQFVGFRIIRPLKVPSPEEMKKFWNNGVERE